MSEVPVNSTVPRRQLGRELRALRNKARLTVKLAAQELEISEAKLWRIETGQTALRSHDVEIMCRIYGAPPDLADALKGLAKETKGKGWWHAYGDVIPGDFDLYIGLEGAMSSLEQYSTELVPGLLQTPDYARALIQLLIPDLSDEELERRVDLRIQRQTLLTRSTAPPELRIALNEAVIRRPLGGRAVMAAQLDHLAAMNELSNVTVHVIPFSKEGHQGLGTGPFSLMRFPTTANGRDHEPPVVYVEGLTGALYLDKPHEIGRYAAAFDAIKNVALSRINSSSLCLATAREMNG
ncbi:helix-turn-helix domain-containing protein [Actinomadura parmotrematis]|uniref:helix-turn-helix domain-containing protein n=1 Tax=Actinomadura parmotrematis TaxID=2864039 RepID=UPI0027E269BB|nr:helix-turn-helix transcriptional regulator [Actinomadura parmotrematis]